MVSSLPIDRIVPETDAPYLSPVPKRGQKNEPLYMLYTVERIAKIHKIGVDVAINTFFEKLDTMLM
jgi:TatD DNase family protein